MLFFSKPLIELQGGEQRITEQHYQYQNAGEVYDSKQSAREVHKAVQALNMPYFRLENVNQQLNQSRTAVHYHMKELEKRGYVIRVGVKYVDAQDLENWTLWQLKRLWKALEAEREAAKDVKELYEDKKRVEKQLLQDKKKEASNRWKKQQVDRLTQIQSTIDFYEDKANRMDRNAKALMRLVGDLMKDSQANCEKSYDARIQDMLERIPVAT